VAEPTAFERELQALGVQLRTLETEYNMYFAGRSARPPLQRRAALERAFRRLDRAHVESAVQRFQFSTLQARYSSFGELWDRGVRAREEGRPGPFVRKPLDPVVVHPAEHLIHEAAFGDPVRQIDTLRDLYEALMQARRDAGLGIVPFHKFANLVREQVQTLQARHPGDDVSFRVSLRDGRVNLTARAIKPSDEPREGER